MTFIYREMLESSTEDFLTDAHATLFFGMDNSVANREVLAKKLVDELIWPVLERAGWQVP